MAQIFISHKSENAKEALAIKQWLKDNGWGDVFLDLDGKSGINQGERWKIALRNAKESCEAVLCLVSPAWLESNECQNEYRYAEEYDKKIFYALIKPCDTQKLHSEWQRCELFVDNDLAQKTIDFKFGEIPIKYAFRSDGLERLRSGLEKARIGAKYFPWPPDKDKDRAPYRGLKPLEAIDAAVFFGRDVEILEGMETLLDMRRKGIEHLLVILGASGSGKSSFMSAGLLPRLERAGREFFPMQAIRPSNSVLFGDEGLASALAQAFDSVGLKKSLGSIEQQLDNGPQGFNGLLTDLEQQLKNRNADEPDSLPPSIVIPIDQAEELFNLDSASGESEKFFAMLASQLTETEASGKRRPIVLLTIRSDRHDHL